MNITEQALYNVNSKRLDFSIKSQNRRDEVYRKIPEYAQLCDEIPRLSLSIMRSDEPEEQKLSVLRDKIQKISKKQKELLIANGYSPDYMEEIFFCNKCKDMGENCECIKREKKRLYIQSLSNAAGIARDCTFDTINLSYYGKYQKQMAAILTYCKQYAAQFETYELNMQNLFLTGSTGLGKTHISLAIAKELVNKGYAVAYHSALDVFGKLENEYFNYRSTEILDILTDIDILIIDDLGAEMDNKFYKQRFYEIVNTRYNAKKPLIINSNLSIKEIERKYDNRIASRLSSYVPLYFDGEQDIRMITNKFYRR